MHRETAGGRFLIYGGAGNMVGAVGQVGRRWRGGNSIIYAAPDRLGESGFNF